ncbi:enoyl-CoA hydratase/isomerase family protein [Pseudoxanthomonas sp.]|uniref:enoyl-CoA hydratase/isomerase family protein n=1 Tax=Pseudoxanthomonas sp. TaxID=1871049 RepID=UPI002631FD17|nr:enoyl-CoA hydratase/isomerase family protein [Pseudoxanthomonas sp.]WDS36940.1 MAG: enoyl-CoA hydratase/isomerase family protein [Pseudoxanthomonas sp.]
MLLERERSCLQITLNMPQVRNALSAQMWQELADVFDVIRDERSIRVVVLRGAGGHFSSGGNTKERNAIGANNNSVPSQQTAVAERNRFGGSVLARIDHAPQAVVAVVQGSALGGGIGLSCAADIVLADHSAMFRLPEAGIGVIPAQIAPYLVRRIGLSQARRLALSAATVRAPEALQIGLVHQLSDGAEALEASVSAVLADIDRCGPHAIAASKALFRHACQADATGIDAYIDTAAELFAAAYCSDEGSEGANALAQRRRPNWQAPA